MTTRRHVRSVASFALVAASVTTLFVCAPGNAAPQRATDTLYVCQDEDGSTPGQRFPCLWDAQAQGNGGGSSFILDAPVGAP